MNLPHLHLLLNHFPTVGFSVGLGLFFVALAGKMEELKKASLVIFFIVAVTTIVTYTTGNAAEQVISGLPEVSADLVRLHEDAALLGSIFMMFTGIVALLGLYQLRRAGQTRSWTIPAILVLSIVTFGLMSRAATIGGEIRHPEIAEGQGSLAGGAGHLELVKPIGDLVGAIWWVWPLSETLHFVGLCLLFTTVLIVNLRMLGMGKAMPFASLYKLLPLGLLGFALNLVTGMVFFISTPGQYTQNVAFFWKLVLIVLGGVNVLYFMLFDEPWKVGAGDDAPLRTKLIAASAIFLWLGVLFFGHMLPFIGNSF